MEAARASVRRPSETVDTSTANPELSKTRAKDSLLYDYNRDKHGLPVGEGFEFPLTSGPRTIGVSSVGLGLYFATGLLTILLMVVLCLINIYPLVNNIQDSNFTEQYYLSPSTSKGQRGVACQSSFASHSFITLSSLGALCASNRTSNAVSCPSLCYVPTEGIEGSDPAYLELFNDTGSCEAYPPCKNGEVANREADEICCERKFDHYEQGSVPIAYYWVIFLGTVVFLAWHLFLRHSQVLSASQINASTVSVGDFTVYVKGLGKNFHTREQLTSFFAHYGEVATAVYTKNLGDFLLLEKKLMDLTVREAELARIVANEEEMDAGCWRGMWFWLYCRQLTKSLQSPKQAIETCQTQISEVKAEMETLQGRHLENTGEALITFNYEAHANNVFRDHLQRGIKSYLAVALCKGGDAPLFQDTRILVYRAPEPSDMYWENMDFRGARLYVRRLVAHSSAIFILGIGAVLQYLLEREKEKARNESIDDQTSELANEDDSSSLEKAKESLDLRAVSFTIAGVVVVMNMLITAGIKSLNEYEAYKTRSQKEMNFILKLTAGHLLNSVFVPIMVADPSYWYVRGGFVEQAFYIQIVNAVLPDVIQLIRLKSRVNIMYMAQFAKTQSQMDMLYAPQTFSIAERYSNILKTFGLSILFGPLLPCSYLIGLLGITISYLTDKYMALRICAKPEQMNQDVVLAFNRMLLFIVIMQYFVCFFGYFKDEDDFGPVFVSGLVFGLVYAVLPIQKIFGIKVDEELEDGGTGGISWEECMKFAPDSNREDPSSMFSFGLEVYAPRLPEYCTEDYKQRVHEEYKLPVRVHRADPSLLPGQRSDTGGDATLPPKRDQNLKPAETLNPFVQTSIGLQPSPALQMGPQASVQGPPMYPPPQYQPPQVQPTQQYYPPAPMPYAVQPAVPHTEGFSAYPATSAYPTPANPYAANPYRVE